MWGARLDEIELTKVRRIDCGENCVGLKQKQAVTGAYRRKSNGLRSAVNVSECRYNVTGALLGCWIHNPKVGGLGPTLSYANGC